jgi:hypothetical protein
VTSTPARKSKGAFVQIANGAYLAGRIEPRQPPRLDLVPHAAPVFGIVTGCGVVLARPSEGIAKQQSA